MEKQKRGRVEETHSPWRAVKTIIMSVAILFVPTICSVFNTSLNLSADMGWCLGCRDIYHPYYWETGNWLLGFIPFIGLTATIVASLVLGFKFRRITTRSSVILTMAFAIGIMFISHRIAMSLIDLSQLI